MTPITNPIERPEPICDNCFRTWRATKPRPVAIFCHHANAVARLSDTGWYVLEQIGAKLLKALRQQGLL